MSPDASPKWLRCAWSYLLMALCILGVDFLTGPFLLFPIFFVVPVMLAAWCYSARWAYALAVALPAGRLVIALWVDHPSPLSFIITNALIRIAVLLLLAYLVCRTARQTRELQQRYSGLVTVCAWSRTIEYEGQWISFEEYLKRRFNIDTSHGMSPAEAEKIFRELKSGNPDPRG
jgi:hypothetical protein